MFNKYILIAFLISLSANFGLTYATYQLHSKVAVTEEKLSLCQQSNKEKDEEIEKLELACAVSEDIIAEYAETKKEVDQEEEDALSQLEELHSEQLRSTESQSAPLVKQEPQVQPEATNEDNTASLDDKLPAVVTRMLDQHYRVSK
tara:strand:- start:47581 stop:48018 length:438 start_codon:yes stop_codon:yes gene_type:complete